MDEVNSVVIHRHQPTRRLREVPAQRYWTVRDDTGRTTLNSAHNPKVIGSNPIPATTKAQVRARARPGPHSFSAGLLMELLMDSSADGRRRLRSAT